MYVYLKSEPKKGYLEKPEANLVYFAVFLKTALAAAPSKHSQCVTWGTFRDTETKIPESMSSFCLLQQASWGEFCGFA